VMTVSLMTDFTRISRSGVSSWAICDDRISDYCFGVDKGVTLSVAALSVRTSVAALSVRTPSVKTLSAMMLSVMLTDNTRQMSDAGRNEHRSSVMLTALSAVM
jgi:hypothetical protein